MALAKNGHKSVKKTSIHTVSITKKQTVTRLGKHKSVKVSKTVKLVKKVKTITTVSSLASLAEPAAVRGGNQLWGQLNYIINTVAAESGADIGVYVKSMKHGDRLYSRNIDRSLTPASTLKVMTAEAALIFLKPEYRFSTQLLTDAQVIKDGVLQGNLYVVLGGDPSLTYNDLVDLILNLRNQEISGLTGNVYIDDTAYDQSFYGPTGYGKTWILLCCTH